MSEAILKANDLVMKFGRKCVLNGVSMHLNRGEILAIVGGSGSGKSTLMRQLALLQTPTSGSIELFGEQVLKLMLELNKELETSLVIVTHDHSIAERMDRILVLENGVLQPLT